MFKEFAVDGDPVRPIYFTQEVSDLTSNHVKAVETLLRFEGLSGRIYHFSRITDKPEDLELNAITRHLFEAAKLKVAKELFAQGYKYVGFNISLAHLADEAWLEGARTLCTVLAEQHPNNGIVFELLEQDDPPSSCVERIEGALVTLRNLGAQFAIDDFGKSGSSLLRLCKLRPEYVKFDREMVVVLGKDMFSMEIISAIVAKCQEAGIIVIAEGVETPEMSALWKDLNVTLQQGYLFDRPSRRP